MKRLGAFDKVRRVEPLGYAVAAIAAYFLGSFPTGLLVGKARGIDIRTVGSGNIGATNITRALGKKIGAVVLLVDALKGWFACWLASRLAGAVSGTEIAAESSTTEQLALTGAVCAILGHNYTCWLKFKGGKGIATTAGTLLALMPTAGMMCIGTWIVFLALTRYVSIASIAAAIAVPTSAWLTDRSPLMIGVGLTVGALAIYKHKDNIRRLIAGKEHRIGEGKSKSSESESKK